MVQRKFVIGDIHGGYKALLQVLTESKFDYDNDLLISLGDLVDGWSESHLVIEELMKIKNLILLRGNHDEWAMKGLINLYRDNIKMNESYEKYIDSTFLTGEGYSWMHHGGKSTYDIYKDNFNLVEKHLDFLNQAKIYHLDDENRFFSHAGPLPYKKIENTADENFFWNRDFWNSVCRGQQPHKSFNKIYIGHTPTIFFNNRKIDNTKPINIYNTCNMDTGACFEGRLSMVNLDTDELFQSDIVRKLYPTERGRMDKSYNDELS